MQGIRESAGWGPASWLPKSNFVEFKDTNRSPSFSGNWRRWSPLSRRLSNGERHRRVGYARAATFHGVSGDSPALAGVWLEKDRDKFALEAYRNAFERNKKAGLFAELPALHHYWSHFSELAHSTVLPVLG